jgi:peroxiredoxin
MNTFAIGFTLLSFLIAVAGLTSYFTKLKKNQTPKYPLGLATTLPVSIALGFYALSLSSSTLVTIIMALPVGIVTLVSATLLFFLLQKSTPIGDIKVKLGDSILPFITNDFEGNTLSTESLKGKRTLLKFYRGSWCPYCSAELKMLSDMQPELDAYGISILALSGDTAAQAKVHIERDNLNFTLLADPELAVVKQYGVEHHKAVGWESNNMTTIFGVSMSLGMFKYRSMPIPTSILIDETGIIQWIDQSEDYRIRASHENLMVAIKHSFQA